MKNQNDIIAIIVAIVLAAGASGYFIFAARKPVTPQSPTTVPTAPSQVPAGSVNFATSLPGGGGGGGAAGGFGGGRRGGPATMGGPVAGGPPGAGGGKWANMGGAPGPGSRPSFSSGK